MNVIKQYQKINIECELSINGVLQAVSEMLNSGKNIFDHRIYFELHTHENNFFNALNILNKLCANPLLAHRFVWTSNPCLENEEWFLKFDGVAFGSNLWGSK